MAVIPRVVNAVENRPGICVLGTANPLLCVLAPRILGRDSMVLSLPAYCRLADVQIDLVNKREVFVSYGVLDLVDVDGVDLTGHTATFPP